MSAFGLQPLDAAPQNVHAGDGEGLHPESCWCSICAENQLQREVEWKHGRYRTTNGIPFERVTLDPRALTMSADCYAEHCGDVDEVALGQAVLLYMEAERAA